MERKDFCETVWDGMVALYGEPGIPALCLALQETHAADVPLLLVLALADHAGLGTDEDGLTVLIAIATEWRDLAVRPLRAVRTALKGVCSGEAELAFRDKVKAIELEAERMEVARLAGRFAALPARIASGELAASYLRHIGVPAHVARSAVGQIAAGLDASLRRHAAG